METSTVTTHETLSFRIAAWNSPLFSLGIATVLTLAVNAPGAAVGTAFGGDDWAWLWVYHTQGSVAVLKAMWQSGHPGYGPFYDTVLYFAGNAGVPVARLLAIGFHLGCGWLVWLIFRDARSSPEFATTAGVLYLIAPFLAGLHGSFAHSVYDPIIFFYLLSIWLSRRGECPVLIAAIGALLIGLSIETLAAIEPIRWCLLYRNRNSVRATIWAALPFLVLIVGVAIIRATWLVPTGQFQGYNVIPSPSIAAYLRLFLLHLFFFVDAREPIGFAASLLRNDSLYIVAALLIGSCVIAFLASPSRDRPFAAEAAVLAIIGLIVLIAAAAPYVAIDRVPSRVDFSARFAVASQFGALVLGSVCINLLPYKTLRVAVLASAIFVCLANQLQLGKWMLYEEQIVGDFRTQIASLLEQNKPQVLLVQFQPPAREFLFLRRACLSSYDTNVSLALAGYLNGSFVYDLACGSHIYANPAGCFVTGFDEPDRCPPQRRTVTFQLDPRIEDFTRLPLLDLLQRKLGASFRAAGQLTFEK